jgi:MFS family permease
MLSLGVGISLTSPYLSLYCTTVLGMSTSEFGLFMATVSLSGVVVNTMLAKYSDQGMDRKKVIIIATLFCGTGYLCYLLFQNYFILLVSISLLLGLGAPTMPQIFASSREDINDKQEIDGTFANSFLRSLFSLGFLIGPLIGSLLLTSVGYRGVFTGTAIIFFSISLMIFFFLHRVPAPKLTPAGSIMTSQVKTTTAPTVSLKNINILFPFLTVLMLNMCNTVYNMNTPLFIVNTLNGSDSQAGLVVSLCAGLEIPLMIVLGGLALKLGNRVLMMSGCITAALYHVLLLLSSAVWQIIAAQLLQASFVALVIAIGLSFFQDLLPTMPGMATILYSNAGILGNLLGNLTGGIIAQLAGFRNVYWVCLLLVTISFIMLSRMKAQPIEMSVSA